MRAVLRRLRDQPWVLKPLVAVLKVAMDTGLPCSERIYRHVPYRGVVEVQVPGGGFFRLAATGKAIENGLYWEGVYAHEPASMAAWMQRAARAQSVLDIGANSGVFALAAAAVGASDVHAFEPLPRVHAILVSNVALNRFPKLHTWQLAVADQPGVADLFDPGGDAPTSASLSSTFSREHFGDIPSSKVPVVSVDHFCSEHGITHIDLIKLDVEGHEEFALRGMRETVLRDRPTILMEVLPPYEARLRDVVVELFGDAYTWTPIDEGDGSPNRNVLLLPKTTTETP